MKKFVVLSALSLLLLTGCNTLRGNLVVDTSYTYRAPIPAPVIRPHRYNYYPGAEFYFDVDRSMYFYQDSGSQWAHSTVLPSRLRGHLSSSYVEIEMNEARPYRRHDYYRNKYNRQWVRPGAGNGHDRRNNRRPQRLNERGNLNSNKHQNNVDRRRNNERYDDDSRGEHRSNRMSDDYRKY